MQNFHTPQKVLAEQLVRRCDPAILEQSLKKELIFKTRSRFPLVSCACLRLRHDILGQTALVDLAGLRDAIADRKR